MKYELPVLATLLALVTARPSGARITLDRREVPQEHSHDRFLDGVRVSLNLNNPNKIQDPVFGLLGNTAASGGAGSITNLDCLHQATADQAFTNAKAIGNVTGQADALCYAALERNTGKVGLASVLCNETAVNPEIAAITQHQDPASTGATAGNKAVVLELAKQLKAIGADPQLALLTGTFAPGSLTDNTGKGNTCDTLNDPQGGCIFSQNLLVQDATPAEISAAVVGISALSTGGPVASSSVISSATTASAAVSASTSATKGCPAPASSATSAAPATSSPVAPTANASPTNEQTFTGTLGGAAPPVTSSAGTRPFTVNGNTFVNLSAALQRSCAIQNTACSNAANAGTLPGTNVAACNAQEAACNAANSAKVKRAALDFGSCSNPAIEFATGLPGRTTGAFVAVDQTDFPHGNALKIDVISAFVCQRLSDSCKASPAAISACTAGQNASAGLTGQASADAFNSALGVSATKVKRFAF